MTDTASGAQDMRIKRVEEALRALVEKLDKMEAPLNSICVMAAVHGMEYSGPGWEPELNNARRVLGDRKS